VDVVASLSQGRTAAAQCGLFTYKSVLVIFEPPCTFSRMMMMMMMMMIWLGINVQSFLGMKNLLAAN